MSRIKLILMAEDDPDDREFAFEAIHAVSPDIEVRYVEDGQHLIDYLKHRNGYSGPGAAPVPSLILLDLNMPRINGYTALEQIKSDPEIANIPIIILTTSGSARDIEIAYSGGAQSFIRKPGDLDELIEKFRILNCYWSGVTELPDCSETAGR